MEVCLHLSTNRRDHTLNSQFGLAVFTVNTPRDANDQLRDAEMHILY